MSSILTIARKELRTAFLSPVALIFLGAFLLVTLFCFFWVEGFFARGLADVRPLFRWLPLLLVFLVSGRRPGVRGRDRPVGRQALAGGVCQRFARGGGLNEHRWTRLLYQNTGVAPFEIVINRRLLGGR